MPPLMSENPSLSHTHRSPIAFLYEAFKNLLSLSQTWRLSRWAVRAGLVEDVLGALDSEVGAHGDDTM
jgi:hypothetical protein